MSKYKRDASFFPLSAMERIRLKALCEVARRLDARHAIPATSSNFSIRADACSFLISRSGIHKRMLEPTHFIRTDLTGLPLHPQSPKPSDETLLHALIYANDPSVGAVVHCHAPELEVVRAPVHKVTGHELLKALGKKGHDEPFYLPVFRNSQDMQQLAKLIEDELYTDRESEPCLADVMAFCLENHGIYCMGKTVAQAELRLEALLHLVGTQGFE